MEKVGTLDHILSSCKVALSQGRYRWRHDTVLRELTHILELERKKKHPKGNTGITFIPFVKEGTTNMPTSHAKKQGILQQASDWTLEADLDKKLQFPDIVQTSLRPDFPAQSVWTTLSFLGIVGRQSRAAVKALKQAAERASSWLWLKREKKLSNEG